VLGVFGVVGETGIDDAVFCHNGLFIAGTKSFESTMKLATMALSE